MKRSLMNLRQTGRSDEAARKQLIRREMRFVLQQDARRFTKQLLARLLDEGCNLHPDLARFIFYEHFMRRLTAALSPDLRIYFCKKDSDSTSDCSHPQYHAAVKYFLTHLSDAETQVVATVLDIIEALKWEWQRLSIKCLSIEGPGSKNLQNLIEQISRVNPDGNLGQHDPDTIHRRLKIAVVASLMRHVRKPDLLRVKYGSLSQTLQRLSRNPATWPTLIAKFREQIPYSQHMIAQSFWRTLNNMDTEKPLLNTTTASKGPHPTRRS